MEINNKTTYISLKDLEVYRLSRELSRIAWNIYKPLDWHAKKINGDQFIESVDSVGANIAEGYGRYHFLDKIKFYYNARASFFECNEHWIELIYQRGHVQEVDLQEFKLVAQKLSIKLNNFITANYKAKNDNN